MAALKRDSRDVLCEEILLDAGRQSEEILDRARREAEAVVATAGLNADKVRQELLEEAHTRAARRKELILAAVPIEGARLRSERVEVVLSSILEQALQRLLARNGFDYRKTVIALAAEAVSHMTGEAFIVKLSQADGDSLGEGLADEIVRDAGRSQLSIRILREPTTPEGGLIVQDSEAHQLWDNGLQARLARLWPELRRQIAVSIGLVSDRD